MSSRLIVPATLLFILYAVPAFPCDAPWNFNRGDNETKAVVVEAERESDGLVIKELRAFFSAVSRVDGDRCPMRPTCSAYCLEVFRNCGFIKGFVMTADRLIRCGGDTTHWTTVREGGYYDPPAHNYFWNIGEKCSVCGP